MAGPAVPHVCGRELSNVLTFLLARREESGREGRQGEKDNQGPWPVPGDVWAVRTLPCWPSVAGWLYHNQEQAQHGQPANTWGEYVRSGDFLESVAENWESEFLQMAAFLLLSAILVQRGAAESKKPDGDERDANPLAERRPDSPWPVQRGGLALKLYSHSLTLALGLLFVGSFALHAVTGVRKFNEEAGQHGQSAVSLVEYLGSPAFWFESLQNWQS